MLVQELCRSQCASSRSWLWSALCRAKSILNSAFPGMVIKSAISQARCEICYVLGQNAKIPAHSYYFMCSETGRAVLSDLHPKQNTLKQSDHSNNCWSAWIKTDVHYQGGKMSLWLASQDLQEQGSWGCLGWINPGCWFALGCWTASPESCSTNTRDASAI